MSFLDKYSNDIHKLCTDHKVKSLYAFGSVLTDQFSQTSDIDLIVDFDRIDVINYADNYFNLKFSLQDILKRPIDLLEEKAIKNPYFRKAINQKRQLVYDINIKTWLYDILNAIIEIESFLSDSSKEFFAYQNDLKTRRAVERNIEIIGEAMN